MIKYIYLHFRARAPKDAIIFPIRETSSRSIKKKSLLHRVACKGCGKSFLTDRDTEYCFDCERTLKVIRPASKYGCEDGCLPCIEKVKGCD